MLKVSKPDAREVLAYALGGFLLFGGYAMGNLYTRKKIGEPLLIATRAMQQDEVLYVHFSELQRESTDRVGIIRLTKVAEQILVHRYTLVPEDTKNIKKIKQIRDETFMYYESIKTEHLTRLFNLYKLEHPKDVNKQKDFEALLTNILTRIHEHVNNIYVLTEPTT